MPSALEIRDGDPWWISPDIWTVPGTNPLGAAGAPIAGSTCYVWARVRNNGGTRIEGATVTFYWANPSVGFDRTTANAIGSAFVSLDGGEEQDVLCLTPWNVVYVNGGHECVLAEVQAPSDPPPGAAFNVPDDPHVAQLNLGVVNTAKAFHYAFEIHNPDRVQRRFAVQIKQGDLAQLKPLARRRLQGTKLPAQAGKLGALGFTRVMCPGEADIERATPHLDGIVVPPGGRVGVSVVGHLDGPAALLHVVQTCDGRNVGGLSLLLLKEDKATKPAKEAP